MDDVRDLEHILHRLHHKLRSQSFFMGGADRTVVHQIRFVTERLRRAQTLAQQQAIAARPVAPLSRIDALRAGVPVPEERHIAVPVPQPAPMAPNPARLAAMRAGTLPPDTPSNVITRVPVSPEVESVSVAPAPVNWSPRSQLSPMSVEWEPLPVSVPPSPVASPEWVPASGPLSPVASPMSTVSPTYTDRENERNAEMVRLDKVIRDIDKAEDARQVARIETDLAEAQRRTHALGHVPPLSPVTPESPLVFMTSVAMDNYSAVHLPEGVTEINGRFLATVRVFVGTYDTAEAASAARTAFMTARGTLPP